MKKQGLCIMFNSVDSTTMYALILLRRWVSVLWVFFSVLKVRPESYATFQKDFFVFFFSLQRFEGQMSEVH